MITSRTFIGAYEVRTGARIPFPSNHDRLSFAISTVCDEENPERWHGEVVFAGETLLTTDPVASHDKAGRAMPNPLLSTRSSISFPTDMQR